MQIKNLIVTLFMVLAGCSLPQTNPNQENSSPGSFITGKSEQGISLVELMNGKNTSAGLTINALLWRASLDIASSIPLDDVDAFGGTIVTEWYQLDAADEDRIKLAIFVLDRELRSDGIRVVVYVQKKLGGIWSDQGTDTEMGLQLEELILTRAREIRAATVSQTQ